MAYSVAMGSICAAVAVGLVVIFAAWVAWVRLGMSRHRAAVRHAIRAYAQKRGGSVQFDEAGTRFRVQGRLGEGSESLTVFELTCRPEERAHWESSIGLGLRHYIPDASYERSVAATLARLTREGPAIAALSDDELRARLRVKIVRSLEPRDHLATCARTLSPRFEVRVVLDGFDFVGLPEPARARLPEDDAELRARAIRAMLPAAPPSADAGRAETFLWLLEPERIFGASPFLMVAEGEALVWMPVTPGDVEARLVALCQRSSTLGPLTNSLWAWDGAALSEETIAVHTVQMENTPDFTLKVPTAFHATLGVHPAADGSFGIRRASRR